MGAISGVDAMLAKLKRLEDAGADRIARKVLNAGLTVVKKAEQSAAPPELKGAIGSRIVSTEGGVYRGKVGVGVGKAARNKARARRATFYVTGTGERFRKRIGGKYSFIKHPTKQQLSTGRERPHEAVESAGSAAIPQAKARMQDVWSAATQEN